MIKDKYRWLENDSNRTKQWVRKQEEFTTKYLAGIKSKNLLRKRFKELLDVDIEHMPSIRKGKYFFRARKKGEDQASVFYKKGLSGKPVLLIDPRKLKFGTIQNWRVSKDGKYIAVEFSLSSNDRHVIKIFDVGKKKFLKDTIASERYPYFQCWNVNSSGFWYMRGEPGHPSREEKYYKRIYYHTLGQSVWKDKLFYGEGLSKNDSPNFGRSHDGRYQTITIHHIDRTTTVYFRDTQNFNDDFINITGDMKALSRAMAENGYIYLITEHKASNRKILRRKILENSLGKWEVFVSESKFRLADNVLLKNHLVIEYIENVSSKLYLLDLKTRKKKSIKLPGLGSVNGFSSEYDGNELFYSFSSLDIPTSNYRLDLKTLKQKMYWRLKLKLPSDLVLRQEWATSKDVTKIPMFILKRKNPKYPSPTLVYAYGGFHISQLPEFRSSVIPFIENGGIFVLANIRGGGEFGKKWHDAIIKDRQHKRFEDLASVLKHLIARKYTVPEKMGVWGGSNGGLLMSVMALRYPKLFKAALIMVPVTDMVRYHLFHGGRWWFYDYGNPEDKKMRKYLLSYSPYHNVGKEDYPAMMIMTGEHDDRVHPMHSYKFFAKLKDNKKQKNALILKIERQAGHGGAGKLKATINKLTDMFSFLYKELGILKN